MAKRKIKPYGTNAETSGAGNEKDDNTSSTLAEVLLYSTQDDNAKIAGLAKGAQSRAN